MFPGPTPTSPLARRHVPGNLYKHKFGSDLDSATNELVMRIQPKESIYLKVNNKVGRGAGQWGGLGDGARGGRRGARGGGLQTEPGVRVKCKVPMQGVRDSRKAGACT